MPMPQESTQEPLLDGQPSVPVGIPVPAAAVEPWAIGSQSAYGAVTCAGAVIQPARVPMPETMAREHGVADNTREATLREWGRKRERRKAKNEKEHE